jgi:glycosyltransferase involved in cell wall biosynthesis
MSNKPLVSIVIACYNDPDVVKAIESASNQTGVDKEVIVIDDGSNKELKTLLKEQTDKIDLLITQKNSGQSIARNQGVRKAKSEFILNHDSDDFFENNFCEKAIEVFQNNENVKIVTCKARRFNRQGTIDVYTPAGGYLNDFLYSNSALGSSMFRKQDWESVGGYEEKLPILGFEDWEFFIKLLKNGGYAHVINEVLFNYQVREGSTTEKIKNLKHDKFRHIILKHQDIYKECFPDIINDLFRRIENVETKIERKDKSIDYRLGNSLLLPMRKIKKLFN